MRGTEEDVVQSEKLQAMGSMLAGLAHELNNPLASVLGYSELLRERILAGPPEQADELREMVDPLVAEAMRARELIRSLLQFSRTSMPVLAAVNVAQALNVVVSLRSYTFTQAGLVLDVNVPDDLWVVAEQQKLQQVFLNIINNALDAMTEEGGTGLAITGRTVANGIEIVFEDDGPGFENPRRVFDPFYTTKPVGTGTGLGLTLVHRFQGEFGGSVAVRNRPDRGATVTLRYRVGSAAPEVQDPEEGPVQAEPFSLAPLPVPGARVEQDAERDGDQLPSDPASDVDREAITAAGEAGDREESGAVSPDAVQGGLDEPPQPRPERGAAVATPASPTEAPVQPDRPQESVSGDDDTEGRRYRILVVEDEAPLRKLQSRILSGLNAEVILASAGLEAREILESEHIDAVVSDVKMPGAMNGADLFNWVCDNRPDLLSRFLFVTGDLHEPRLAELLRQSPERFITKPFQIADYTTRIRRLFEPAPPEDEPAAV